MFPNEKRGEEEKRIKAIEKKNAQLVCVCVCVCVVCVCGSKKGVKKGSEERK
jgi:hypothetical protein